MTPAPNCCSGSSPPPTNAAHWRSAPIGPSSNGAASCPSTPPPPASWTGCSTTPASSSPTVTPSACATPNTSEVSAPELTSNPAREWGLYLATSGDFNMATDRAAPASYATVKRRLRGYAQPRWRQALAAASAAHAGLGPASLVLFDVSTLYFETDAGDGFREPGFSKERRLEPQITLGLLTDAAGFPLTVQAFEGNKAETATMLPVINAFKAAHQLTDVTVVADPGMISEANQIAVAAAGLSFVLGTRLPYLPDVVREWRDKHPGEAIPDGLVLTQPWPSTSAEKARGIPDRVIHYQFRHDRARRTLRGIDEQIAKAQRAVDGHAPVKRNRYIQLSGATKSVNRTLEAKTRALAGWKGYTTNLTTESAQFVVDAYHQLWHIEKAFRMSKHDLQARPIYHHLRESIEAHLSVVVAAMAVSHYIEHQTGWSIKKFVRTTRRYRTVKIRAGRQILTAADPLSDDLHEAIAKISGQLEH